jgi:hypothetical protein
MTAFYIQPSSLQTAVAAGVQEAVDAMMPPAPFQRDFEPEFARILDDLGLFCLL